jgi:hypothetical protein
MSSVQSALAAQPRRQYVTAAPFNNDFFTYTLTTNPATLVTTGALNPVTGANAGNCPAGRILRESGLKLYPGVNNNVTTFMVGVIDTVTLLAGYIDPNSPIYAVYSTQLPGFYANGVDPGPQGLPDQGPPVITNGNIAGHVMPVTLYNTGFSKVPYTPGNTGCDVFLNPNQGSVYYVKIPTVDASINNIYVYYRNETAPAVAVTPVQGIRISTIIENDVSGHNITATFQGAAWYTSGTLAINNAGNNSTVSTLSAVSNGTYLAEIGRVASTSLT